MKVNLKKVGAVLAGAAFLASSVAFATLTYEDTELVNVNGQPVAKVVVGEKAAASDGVAAANIAAKLANKAYATKTVKAMVKGAADGSTCTTTVSDKSVTLKVTMPGLSSTEQAKFNLLIAEQTDMSIGERNTDDADAYTDANDLWDKEANPFQDQEAGMADFDGAENANYLAALVDGNNFAGFKTRALTGKNLESGMEQLQRIYFDAKTSYDDEEILTEVSQVVYQVVFGSKKQGLNLCPGDSKDVDFTEGVGTGAGQCRAGKELSASRVKINLLGDDWYVTDVDVPADTYNFGTKDEVQTIESATVKLAKESSYGIINIGQSLEAQGYKVTLEDISKSDDNEAIVAVYSGDTKDPIVRDQIKPGESKEINVGGSNKLRVHVYQTAPGYTFGSKWAEMAILADEIELEGGEDFIDDDDTEYTVFLGFTNKMQTSDDDAVTHLKAISLVGTMSSDTEELGKGDALPIIDVAGYKAYELANLGLTEVTMDTLEMSYTRDIGSLKFADGTTEDLNDVAGIYIKSTNNDAFKSTDVVKTLGGGAAGTVNGKEMYYLLEDPGPGSIGDVLIKDADDKEWYYLAVSDTGGANSRVEYKEAGDYGYIYFEGTNNGSDGYDGAMYEIYITESIGEVDGTKSYGIWGVKFDTGTEKFMGLNDDDTDEVTYSYAIEALGGTDTFDEVVAIIDTYTDLDAYGYTGNAQDEETGFISPRGSLYKSEDDKTRKFEIASKIREMQLVLRPTGASTEADTTTLVLAEGATGTAGDATIKVEKIDVKCTATATGGSTGGAATAVLVDAATNAELGAQKEFSMPYATGQLVMLDSEVTDDTGVLITVGGNAVNSVSAAAMKEAGLTLSSTDKVVVKAVGKKIVVAGYTSTDTLAAADEFLAALKG